MDWWFEKMYWKMFDDLRIGDDRRSARAVKAVTYHEPLLRTDGQGRIVFPECFIVEAFLEMIAVMVKAVEHDRIAHLALLKIIAAHIHRAPRLGERVLLEVQIARRRGTLLLIEGTATLDGTGELIAEAQMLDGLMTTAHGLARLVPRTGASVSEPAGARREQEAGHAP